MQFDGRVACAFDAPAVLDTSVSSIPANSGGFLTVIVSTPLSIQKIRYTNNTGKFIGVYKGASGAEVYVGHLGINTGEMECVIPRKTRVSLRSLDSLAIVTGTVFCDFLARTDAV